MSNKTVMPSVRESGISLIEVMITLVVGSFIILGTMTVFMQSRTTYRVNESVSRLQENARFVLDVISRDIRMASYYGLTSRTDLIGNSATPLDPIPAGLAVGGDCGPNWTINLDAVADGSNNGYAWACPSFGNGPQALADTLVIRRVTEDLIPVLQPQTMYLQSARFRESQLFVGTVPPAGFHAVGSQTHGLVVNGYYISQNSSFLGGPGNPIPSLRVKTLVPGPLGPVIVDKEVLAGVEDLQVEFGVDTDLVDTPNRGSINRYVNPGDPIITPGNPGFIPDAEIIAVRIWLRVRAERIENGFTDTTPYAYADRNIPPQNDAIRRMVVSKTIFLRNARSPS
ncbi:MAG: PilW family protein [Candidatus Rariloculaceae bacterium]